MLSAADQAIIAADPALPGLALLLDPDAMTATLDRLYPRAAVRSARARYVRYKPGTSCLVGYDVEFGAGSVHVYARAHTSNGAEKLDKAAGRESVPSPLGDGILLIADRAVVIYPFPNDHELQSLGDLTEPDRRRQLLEHLLPEPFANATATLLRYKPERRLVARVDGPGGERAIVKFYTDEDFIRAKDNAEAFTSDGPLRVPRRLGRSKRRGAAAIEWLEGTSLAECLAGADQDRAVAACRTTGAALARLHVQKPTFETYFTAEAYARTLDAAAVAVEEILPGLGAQAGDVAGRLGALFLQRHWRGRRAVHGDFSADQVLVNDDVCAIVDFDRAGRGDPRLDLGSFGARLEYDVVCGTLDRVRADVAFEALLESYREASDKDVTRKLGRYTAASLLQLTMEPFRHRREGWPELTRAILDRAEALGRKRQEVEA